MVPVNAGDLIQATTTTTNNNNRSSNNNNNNNDNDNDNNDNNNILAAVQPDPSERLSADNPSLAEALMRAIAK